MYIPTVADWFIISIIVVMGALLYIHWPAKGDNSPPDINEYLFRMGLNSVRMGWDASTGQHDIAVITRRLSDHKPNIGDVVTFIEEDDTRFRTRVVDIPSIITIDGQEQIILTVEAV